MAALYAPDDNPALGVAVVAATHFVLSPSGLGDSVRQLTINGQPLVTEVTAVAPGSLGGYAVCGRVTSGTDPGALCAWSDHGSVGAVVALNRTTDDTADLLRTARPLVLKRH